MTFGVTAVLFALCVVGIVLLGRFCRTNRAVRIAGMAVLAVLALAFAMYMGLTIILVDAVANQPPTM